MVDGKPVARPTIGRCNRRPLPAPVTVRRPARSRVMKALPPRPTANSSIRCSKGRCGMPRRRTSKRSTARKPRGFSNSMSPRKKFTGRYWHYVFEANGDAIGDFNMIDGTDGLIIERDNGEGTATRPAPQGQRGANCFPTCRQVQAHLQGRLRDANVGKPARKIGYIDLMKIKDPEKQEAGRQRRLLRLAVLHHRERRPRRRHAHHRRQRQQPAVLVRPRAGQGRRQRVRAGGRSGNTKGPSLTLGMTPGLALRVDRLAALQHLDEGLRSSSCGRPRSSCCGAEGQREAVLRVELREHLLALGSASMAAWRSPGIFMSLMR